MVKSMEKGENIQKIILIQSIMVHISECISQHFVLNKMLVQHRLRWFGHPTEAPEAPVHSKVISQTDNEKGGRGRPTLTWEKFLRRDLKNWSITKELALDRREWKLAIHVPKL
jgi:hypothetical protein